MVMMIVMLVTNFYFYLFNLTLLSALLKMFIGFPYVGFFKAVKLAHGESIIIRDTQEPLAGLTL